MQLILVRHAHAGSRRAWTGDDRDRPLSEKGRWQANELASTLAERAPTVILSSPRRRCIQTVEPLAAKVGLMVDVDDRLDEGPDIDQLMELFHETAGETAILASHGDVIPEFLGYLRARHGMVINDRFVWPKASTWVIRRDPEGAPVRAKCLLPPVEPPSGH